MAIGRERPELEDQLSGFDALRLAIALGLLPATDDPMLFDPARHEPLRPTAWSDAAARAATIAA
jgi:hypothetical protein